MDSSGAYAQELQNALKGCLWRAKNCNLHFLCIPFRRVAWCLFAIILHSLRKIFNCSRRSEFRTMLKINIFHSF